MIIIFVYNIISYAPGSVVLIPLCDYRIVYKNIPTPLKSKPNSRHVSTIQKCIFSHMPGKFVHKNASVRHATHSQHTSFSFSCRKKKLFKNYSLQKKETQKNESVKNIIKKNRHTLPHNRRV